MKVKKLSSYKKYKQRVVSIFAFTILFFLVFSIIEFFFIEQIITVEEINVLNLKVLLFFLNGLFSVILSVFFIFYFLQLFIRQNNKPSLNEDIENKFERKEDNTPPLITKDIIQFSHKIDEQKELVKFKAAVEQNPNLILITDISGNIEYVNPSFTEVTGYLFSDVITLNPRFMKTEKQSASFYREMWQTISSGRIWKGELLNRKANGQTFWEFLSISPIKNKKGEIINYLGIAQDISDRKIAEFRMKRMNDDLKLAEHEARAANEELKTNSEALEQSYHDLKIAKDKAEESDKLKSAFLANMSHEIRTPLNGIIGFSDLLTGDNISKEKRLMYKAVITASSNQLLKMVTDIIDISKLESGQVEIFKSSFNLNELLDELLVTFKTDGNLKEKKSLRITCTKELPNNYVNIVSDQDKIKQVFINLISNAIKFSSKGEINFGYLVIDDIIQCYVKDQGIGIAKENQEIIFNQFRQVEGSLNRQFGGAGIGLSIAKGYIELLDGEIWLDSVEDHGSTFYFSIPYSVVF